MVKIAWAKHLLNAYNNINKTDKVYDTNGSFLGESDGVYARPTDKSSGSVCLVRKGKFIWISGDIEKTENGWKVQKNTKIRYGK
tara:strand:- start:9150 stop:9401 length:252 start_codon:yes stop_codon:yes gene_type:complete